MPIDGGAGGEFEVGDELEGGFPVEEGGFNFGAVGVVADGAFAGVEVVLDAGGLRLGAGFGILEVRCWRFEVGFGGGAGFAWLGGWGLLRRGFGGRDWCWGRGGLLRVGGPSFVRVKRRCRRRWVWDLVGGSGWAAGDCLGAGCWGLESRDRRPRTGWRRALTVFVGSFDFPLDRVGLARSEGEARLAFAAGDDVLGCDRAALLCALLLCYGAVIVKVSWRVGNGTEGLGLDAERRRPELCPRYADITPPGSPRLSRSARSSSL